MSPEYTLSEDDSSLFRRNITLLEKQITQHLPAPLMEQLHPGSGRLIVPVGSRYHQLLTVIERKYSRCRTWVLEETPVTFVPLVSSLSS